MKKEPPLHESVKLCLDAKLIEVEYYDDGPSDCGHEIVLIFDNSHEISIYNHPEQGLIVEGD